MRGRPVSVGKVIHTCGTCGESFYEYASRNQRFCSQQCKGAAIRTHGESESRLYVIWKQMKARCVSTNKEIREYYRDRGITVCQEWKSYEAFRDWAMSHGYADNLSLDRKDTDGNYEPDNCRWITHRQQTRNSRKRKNGVTSQYKGVCRSESAWIANVTVNGKTKYLGSFSNEIAAAEAYDDFVYAQDPGIAYLNFPSRKNMEQP